MATKWAQILSILEEQISVFLAWALSNMRISKLRRAIQIISTLIHNSYFGFPFTGNIYTGSLKQFCAPGLNCYSCPSALFSCPLGALQQVLISFRILPFEIVSKALLYVIGQIVLFSLFLGRLICGWLCPFGFLQDLLYRIPFYKRKLRLPFSIQRYIKHGLLVFLVISFPLVFIGDTGYGTLWFCKYFCPVGTLEAGIFTLLLKPELKELIGKLFFIKLILLMFILLLCVIEIRFFCKNLCPLGLIYGLFNRFSFFQLYWQERVCSACGLCEKVCPMDLRIPKDLNSVECIRCLQCVGVCPTKAIHLKKSIYYLPKKYQKNLSIGALGHASRRKSTN